MKPKNFLFSVIAAFLTLPFLFTGCKNYKKVPTVDYAAMDRPSPPDYASMDNWAAHPTRDDFADGAPCEEVCDRQGKAMVDVFFLHPTTYYNGENWNAEVNNAELNQKTDETTIKHQASIFNGHARVFAPRYRQTVFGAFFMEDTKNRDRALQLTYSDVRRAFQYYLDNENDGRPIIIAAHSQGSCLSVLLLQEFFDGKPLADQLVTAYVVGWPVMRDSFQVLQPCTNPTETGCYNTWGTYRWGYYPEFYEVFNKGAVVTNPLNWTIDGTYADRSLHEGAVLRKYNKFYKHAMDAQGMDGILWVHPPKNVPIDKKILYNWKNYHIADYNLFWKNVRNNVRDRAKAYLLNHPSYITGDKLPEDMFGELVPQVQKPKASEK